MAQEPEPGHIGACGRSMREQATRGRSGRLDHGRHRIFHDPTGRKPARISGEDHTGAERLGEDQPVAGAQPFV